jgi:hypothetical protein
MAIEPFIHVPAAQLCVTGGGLDLEDALAYLHDGDVQCAAAQIKDHDLVLAHLIQAKGQSRSRGLIDDANDLQAGDGSCILGRLPLIVIEVGRDGYYGFIHGVTQVCLCIRLDLAQDLGRYILRAVLLSVNLYFVVRAHLAFDARDGAIRIGD